ncbi:hypothetical protein Tco_0839242 [Tanacetum coccineum]|uniref:Uncharacterized protein n=1 Tax=Tanacetum coccineum TaxID=301880 RepID=A0ABQ5AQ31_9ASTR
MVDVNVNAPAEEAPAMAPPTHEFWDTVRYDNKSGSYSCQLDEQWFDLTKDTLRDTLQITLVDNNNAFSSPPTLDALIKFVNDLGYPKVVRTLSDVITTCFSHGEHSQQLSTCVLQERLQGLKDQGLWCYRFYGASSIEPILIMLRGCGKNLPNPSIPSSMTKGNWHDTLRERRKPPLL